MHVYISGVSGSGLSSLAHFCLDLDYEVSGSDLQITENTISLLKRGLNFSQRSNEAYLAERHQISPLDYIIFSPSIPKDHPERILAKNLGIKVVTQNWLINLVLEQKSLSLIAISGTHGKTTTTAMLVWLFKKLNIPVSYIIGTDITFGNSGHFEKSKYFIYEADEYNRKFLELKPELTIIPSLDYDHPDTYPTRNDYFQAFADYIAGSKQVICFPDVLKLIEPYLKSQTEIFKKLSDEVNYFESNHQDKLLCKLSLPGLHNRLNALLCIYGIAIIFENFESLSIPASSILIDAINSFPGTSRRFECLSNNLYSDYAHHPAEIKATIQLAREVIDNSQKAKKLIIIYQPHQNLRQIELKESYTDIFNQADLIYWLPTYLSRENPNLKILSPEDLTTNLENKHNVLYAQMDDELNLKIKKHLDEGDLVLGLGAGSIDKWLRELK